MTLYVCITTTVRRVTLSLKRLVDELNEVCSTQIVILIQVERDTKQVASVAERQQTDRTLAYNSALWK